MCTCSRIRVEGSGIGRGRTGWDGVMLRKTYAKKLGAVGRDSQTGDPHSWSLTNRSKAAQERHLKKKKKNLSLSTLLPSGMLWS